MSEMGFPADTRKADVVKAKLLTWKLLTKSVHSLERLCQWLS